MEGLYAYSDESGNTGLSLFDAQQPWFWTVTLIAPKDLDPPATKAVARWRKALAMPDLHVVDPIIDNGINPAIPAHVYGNRLLRLGLAHAIVSNISPRSQEEWWRVFETGDIDGFRLVVKRVRVNVEQKVKDRRVRACGRCARLAFPAPR